MFDFITIIIIIVIFIAIYYITSIHSSAVIHHIEKTKNFLETQIDDLMEKITELEESIANPMKESNKKMKDLYSLYNKKNEVNLMNNQKILKQINQYDEDKQLIDTTQVFNSVESDKNKIPFVKNEEEPLYMSSDNSDKSQSDTSSNSSVIMTELRNIKYNDKESEKTKSQKSKQTKSQTSNLSAYTVSSKSDKIVEL